MAGRRARLLSRSRRTAGDHAADARGVPGRRPGVVRVDRDLHIAQRPVPVRHGRRRRRPRAPYLEGLIMRTHPPALTLITTLAALTLSPLVPAAAAQTETEVVVERVRPQREKHTTLQFLKQNRDFIRYRYD